MFVGGPNERLDYHLEEGEEVYLKFVNAIVGGGAIGNECSSEF